MPDCFVIFDGGCGLCRRVVEWMRREPAYLPIRFVAGGSQEARERFPTVPAGELAFILDKRVWLGDHAFLMCLWALRDYRGWAQRFSSPALLPMARQFFRSLSSGRGAVSRVLGCDTGTCASVVTQADQRVHRRGAPRGDQA